MNTQCDWLCVFMSSDEGSGRASGGNGGGRDIIIDVLFEGGKARQSFDIRAVGRKWTDRRTSTKGFGVKSGDGLQFGVGRFQKSVDVRFGERSMQRIETKMEFAVAWWSQRLASRMASKLVSPIDPRGSLRSLAAAVEKRGDMGLPFGGRRCGGKGAAVGIYRAGHDSTAIAGYNSQEAASQARPRAPSGPWLAQ
jgi:hypothetical protein